MTRILRIALMCVVTGVMVFNTMGCNTMEGAGQDVERAGEKIQDAADK